MLVSVVTPTLNSARWMPQCIGSVLMQQTAGVEVEHVVADGGSTDDTVSIAKEHGCVLAPRDPDDGIFDAVNKATRYSSGELVGFLGSDDALLPGALDAVVRRYRSSGRRWVTGSYLWVDAHFRPLGRIAAPPGWMTAEMMATLSWSPVNHMASYVERSLFDEIGGFDPRHHVAADFQFFLEALRRAPFAREPQTLAVFRRHGSNQSIVHDEHDLPPEQQISARYGPASPVRRALYRRSMQVWFNGRNPTWAYRKRVPLPSLPEAPAAPDPAGEGPLPPNL